MYKIERGRPIFGATVDDAGVNFAIFSKNGTSVVLEVYENFYDEKPFFSYELDKVINKTGDVWHVYIYGLKDGLCYGWRINGPYEPEFGHRFNKNKLLIDPYAKAISGTFDFGDETIYGYDKKNKKDVDLSYSIEDSAHTSCKGVIVDDRKYDWEDDKKPRVPLKDSVIYEMHTRLFTMNPNSKVSKRGTFEGICEKLPYLKKLGVTSIELLPIFEFNINSMITINPQTKKRLKDVWGYNPVSFFAVTGNYSYGPRIDEQVYQFKDFVKKVHKEGLEVILDVVYNHTGEGNEHGPTLSFKGIDNSVFYILEKNKRYYSNYSGTGNTLNCSHAVVKGMILESLRYWVTEMHVDGFRFDLAAILGRDSTGRWIGDLSLLKDIANDPVISGSKLIAEGWDAAGGYFVGEFPEGWAEWNGKFRDTVRKFIKGDHGMVSDLATRIVGSPDLFDGRKPYHSINFITAHDGFTMYDLVSHNQKNNLMNGENNRDGENHNNSYNHGIEGETEDKEIVKLRKKQMKNMINLLMLSQGVPMILMGDEIGRTQDGNNNAYCQDNIISWMNWEREEKFSDLLRFVTKMIEFRKQNKILCNEDFFDYYKNNIIWHGTVPETPDWSYYCTTIAFEIVGESISNDSNSIYAAFNSYHEPIEFTLPVKADKKWYRVVDTALVDEEDFKDEPVEVGEKYIVDGRSSIILIQK